MNIGLIFAMEKEATVVANFLKSQNIKVSNIHHPVYHISQFTLNNIHFTSIISKIGKAFSSSATTVLIENFKVQAVINIGSCGGFNCNIGDIIIANEAFYHDVDVTGFGYKKGQIPKQELVFKSNSSVFKLHNLVHNLKHNYIHTGLVATGDQFVNDLKKVEDIINIIPNIKAIEMEGAAIAQICHNYNMDFLLIKKVSDIADKHATASFKNEIIDFDNKVQEILLSIISSI